MKAKAAPKHTHPHPSQDEQGEDRTSTQRETTNPSQEWRGKSKSPYVNKPTTNASQARLDEGKFKITHPPPNSR